jgi:hypothetical protein
MSTGKRDEGLLDAVLEVARVQASELAAMRMALERGDRESALEHAKILAGLAPGAPTITN